MASCAQCPTNVPADARFCPGCGATVEADEGVTRSRPLSPATPREASPSTPVSGGIDHGRFLPGEVLGPRFRIVALLGRGGMGEVYRADDLKVGQAVALKFLPSRFAHDAERRERLLGEVRAARDVAHPNVCRVYDVSEVAGEHFIAMELVHGEDLAHLLRRIGHLPADKALQIARQLCAGLAAAHARGVLHRDLKPANVMLDEQGAVRIMDFGLAGSGFSGAAVREGTPGYMAPEQLAGQGVSVASDIYALGLVLYELFTGKPAFPRRDLAERAHALPPRPSTIVEGIDDATERAILDCLEPDPERRPRSASAVAMALPGGDPLAVALAAGETPSPEMVAAAGGRGALAHGTALALLGSTLLLVVAVIAVFPYSTDLGLSPLPRSPDALADRAHDVLRGLGYREGAIDEVSWFDRNYDYLLWEANHPRPLRRIEAWPGAATFVHREGPRPLVPFANSLVTAEDPPATVSGMAMVRLSPEGALLDLVIEPPQVEKAPGPWPEPDWAGVLAPTGLDHARMHAVEPEWTPPVGSDARRAWVLPAGGDRPEIRVEAAAFHGRPVYLAVIGPWTRPGRMPEVYREGKRGLRPAIGAVAGNVLVTVVLATAVILARRNLRLGRGDRVGAFRVAATMALAAIVGRLLHTHHVADVAGEWRLFLLAVALGMYGAVFTWLAYLALEPSMRRRWPAILIGWNRALGGRISDPLVGRDLLLGARAGALLALVNHVANALPSWIAMSGQTPLFSDRRILGSAPALFGVLATCVGDALFISLLVLGLLFVARLAVDRPGPATALTALTLGLLNLGAENFGVESIVAVISGVVPALVLTRHGLLALTATTFVCQLLLRFPLSLELSRWYGGTTLLGLATLAVLLGVAFRISLGGRLPWRAAALEG